MQSEGKGSEPLRGSLAEIEIPHVHSDQSLDLALERMGAAGLQVLPVVSRFDARQVLGVVYLADIFNAYRIAVQSIPPPGTRTT